MTNEQLRRYYKACLKDVKERMESTELTEEQKWKFGYTEARVKDLERCLAELDK